MFTESQRPKFNPYLSFLSHKNFFILEMLTTCEECTHTLFLESTFMNSLNTWQLNNARLSDAKIEY